MCECILYEIAERENRLLTVTRDCKQFDKAISQMFGHFVYISWKRQSVLPRIWVDPYNRRYVHTRLLTFVNCNAQGLDF